jgi:hypothetical protein
MREERTASKESRPTAETPDTSSDESFIFVVDGALLEQQSIILALSLHRAHGHLKNVKNYAYVSERSRKLSELLEFVYDTCNIKVRNLPAADGRWFKPYPHGNKILACSESRPESWTTFLDTDIIVCKDISGLRFQHDAEFLAVPEGLPTWGEGDKWARAYAHIGQEVPKERVTLVRGRELLYPPYFNAGFLSFSEAAIGIEGRKFGAEWLELASDFDRRCPVSNKRPWLDQITLPLTLYKHGIRWKALPDFYNYSLAKRGKIRRRENSVKVMHYHSFKYLEGRSYLKDQLEWLLDIAPPGLHRTIEQNFLNHGENIPPLPPING